jgi:translation initiation factor IF-2
LAKKTDKSLKLQVKNVQIAEAINLRGLKAKLSKKKSLEEEKEAPEAHLEEAHFQEAHLEQAAISPAKELEEVKKKKTKKPQEPLQKAEREAPSEIVQEVVQKEVVRKVVQEVVQTEPKATLPPAKTEIPQKEAPQIKHVEEVAKKEEKPKAPPPVISKQEAAVFKPGKLEPKREERREERIPHAEGFRRREPKPSGWKDTGQRPPRPPQEGGPQRRPPFREGGPRPQESRGGPSHGRPFPQRGPEARFGQPSGAGPRPPRFPSAGTDARTDARRAAPFTRPAPRPPLRPTPRPDFRGEPRARPQVPIPAKTEGLAERKASERVERKPYTEFEAGKKPKLKAKEPIIGKGQKKSEPKGIDARVRHGIVGAEEEELGWRKRRPSKQMRQELAQEVIRPSKISVRIPISVKDLAAEMKLKASELIAKLFLQGTIVTLNDLLTDDVIIQLLGQEFGCEITIDTKEEERIRITDRTIKEEIASFDPAERLPRPPVVAFMGHVDHGKTSLIDYIRKSNVASHEVGAITQHIGAFRVATLHGDITILDTPGHEAFSHMRERGAEVTDMVVLVVAGDEGMKEQTIEAMKTAKQAGTTIVVALTKCDKPHFNADNVYRQLAEHELLPEAWGGQTICIACSAVTGQGVLELLEMLALQAEVLELKANPNYRARGAVIESEMHKGLGAVACVLVQNGTLKVGDCLVFSSHWARVKSMRDEAGHELQEATPSTPVVINGLSGLPDAGDPFIVVKNEKEAREIAEARLEGKRQTGFLTKKRMTLESMMEKPGDKKVLNLLIRADVQGSSEALKNSILKIYSKKVETNILSTGVGDITESDVQLAQASKATIIGFHTSIDSHVEATAKELGVPIRLHNIIYHAVDDIRELMKNLLDKIPQEVEKGKVEVKATFKSSQLGLIAGCQVLDGSVTRNCQIRVLREGKLLWKGSITSLRRQKDDVREVQKGMECGILLQGYSDFLPGDILEAFEVTYLTQDL